MNRPVVPVVVVLLSAIVGEPVVFHTIPRSVIVPPPSLVTVAPSIAVVLMIDVAVGKARLGGPHGVFVFHFWFSGQPSELVGS